MIAKQYSVYSNTLYLSDNLPDGCTLNPNENTYAQIEITQEEFNNIDKEYVGDVLLLNKKCSIYKMVT